jgi:ribonucleoside-diphosphate reductase alpha chain
MEKKHLIEVNHFFQLEIVKKGLWEEELIKKIAQTGTIEKIKLPEELKKIFITALEISPEWHVKMQSVFQKYVDNAVSKTINLPEKSSANDVKKAYLLAYRLKCKGITVYRYGSKPEQVLYLGKGGKLTTAELHYSGGCIGSVCSF